LGPHQGTRGEDISNSKHGTGDIMSSVLYAFHCGGNPDEILAFRMRDLSLGPPALGDNVDHTAPSATSTLLASLADVQRAPLGSLSIDQIVHVVERVTRREPGAVTVDVAAFNSSI
jgi:FXSXX-COOH protein